MTAVFMRMFYMSLAASGLILAVILIRLLIKSRAPKWILPILWILVGVRLMLPVSVESVYNWVSEEITLLQEGANTDTIVSNGNSASSNLDGTGASNGTSGGSDMAASGSDSSVNASDSVKSGIGASGNASDSDNSDTAVLAADSVNTDSMDADAPNEDSSIVNLLDHVLAKKASLDSLIGDHLNGIERSVGALTAVSVIWLAGMIFMLAYGLIGFVRLSHCMKTAVRLRENIYQSEWVKSPFLLGIIRPRIYIPWQSSEDNISDSMTNGASGSHVSHMEENTKTYGGSDSKMNPLEYVIAHEQAHIRRHDHWTKPIGFVLLAVYWFNPLVWAAYLLFCKDIEYACDEAVIRHLNAEHRADYSQVLLNCHISQHRFAACPVSFGETSVKTRVKSILNYRKPKLWVIVIAVLLVCGVLVICFFTNPLAGDSKDDLQAQIDALDVENAAHVELRLEDMVLVDADVTPYEDYKDGVSAYYIHSYTEKEDCDAFSYETDPVLFGESLDTQLALLNSYFGSSLEASSLDAQYTDTQITISVSGTEEEKLFAYWNIDDSDNLEDVHVYYPYSDSGNWQVAADMAIGEGYVNTADCRYDNASEEVQDLADQAKALVTELTGYEVSDYCLCIPLEEMGDDCYAFYCFYTTDGIPWIKQELIAQFDSQAQLSDEVMDRYITEDGVTNLYAYSAEVYSMNGQLYGINAYDFLSVGDVYREKEEIVSLKELLTILENYYAKIIVPSDITITDIRLVYNAYFSDSSDGEVSHILTPYWYVQYYMGEYSEDTEEDGAASAYGNHCLIFDAYTGAFMSDSIFED